ncbi:MAG: hypothetical protein AAF577_12160 [Pseudomonadota bacterium]
MTSAAVFSSAIMLSVAAQGADPGPAPPAPIVAFTISDGRRIDDSLTGRTGIAARGLRLYEDAARSGCISCHGVPDAPGLTGAAIVARSAGPRPGVPALDAVGIRLTAPEIRLWLVAPAFLTTAPGKQSIYAGGQRGAPDDPLFGGPRLTAAEAEDLVAWLSGLTGTD